MMIIVEVIDYLPIFKITIINITYFCCPLQIEVLGIDILVLDPASVS